LWRAKTEWFNAADRIAWLQNPWNERTSFTHDAAGRRTLKKLANGTRASFTYDGADRLTM
jgi:YD repeat-containing protein